MTHNNNNSFIEPINIIFTHNIYKLVYIIIVTISVTNVRIVLSTLNYIRYFTIDI